MKPFILSITLPVLFAVCAGAGTLRVPLDRQTIQAAIDAAEEGDRIVVSPGTWRGRLVLKPRITLVSSGDAATGEKGLQRAERTVIDGSGEAGTVPGVVMAEGAVLDGFTVTGMGAFDEPLWRRHWEERGRLQDHGETGAFGAPAVAADGVSCQILNCIVHHNGQSGIALRGRKGAAVNTIVTGNRCFRNMGGGIGIMEGAGGIIQQNECYENFFAGIGHSGETAPLVMDNDCHGNVRAGIGISEGACPVVRGNHCHGNRRAGIGIRTGAGTRPVVEDNRCESNGMAGIGVEEGAEPVLRGNHCVKNKLAGIGADSGAKPIIVANDCRENGAAGIGFSSGCEGILFRNVCEANTLVALGLAEKARAIVVDNTFSRDGGVPPLVAVKGGSEAILSGNKLNGGGVAGVLVEGRAILSGNRINGPGGQAANGIWLWKGSRAMGTENSVSGFRAALTVSPDANWAGERP